MQEQPSREAVEAEIAQLSKAIEEKRASLAEGGKTLENPEEVRAAIKEQILDIAVPAAPASVVIHTPNDDKNTLDAQSADKVNAFLEQTFVEGIRKTVARIASEDPFIVDVYHDALVDRLYDELVSRKMIS